MKRRIDALKKEAEQLKVNATSIRELDVGGKNILKGNSAISVFNAKNSRMV